MSRGRPQFPAGPVTLRHAVALLLLAVVACGRPTSAPASPRVGSDETPTDPVPAKSDLDPSHRLAVGGRYACFVAAAGDVYCWGRGADRAAKVRGLKDVVEVSSGYGTACARTRAGRVWCWTDGEPKPVDGVVQARRIAVGQTAACAIVGPDSRVVCWGGVVPMLRVKFPPTEVGAVTGATDLALGFYHGCALVEGGEARCWGSQDWELPRAQGGAFDFGFIDEDTWVTMFADQASPHIDFDTFWKRAKTPGDAALHCLGEAGATRGRVVMRVEVDATGELERATAKASPGSSPQLAEALAKCPAFGRLRVPLVEAKPAAFDYELAFMPVQEAALLSWHVTDDVTSIAARGLLNCATRSDKKLVCWGMSHGIDGPGVHGDLHIGSRKPVALDGFDEAVAVSVGWNHMCVRDSRGAQCYGSNRVGQLGFGPPHEGKLLRHRLDEPPRFSHVAAGATVTCGLADDDAVWCWGSNDGGRLGIASARPQPHPPTRVVGLPGP